MVMANVVSARLLGRSHDAARLALIADGLAAAVVASLPWATSVTAILIVVWLAAFALTQDRESVQREIWTWAGGLPVLLWVVAAVGMVWADGATWAERLAGLGGFHKLLLIPLLLAQFRSSKRGLWVLYAFLASCTVLMAVSWFVFAFNISIPGKPFRGIPVKDYIAQSAEFLICLFGLAGFAIEAMRRREWMWVGGAVLLAALFLANIAYVSTGRTALVVIVFLFALMALLHCGWKGRVAAVLAGIVLCAGVWASSSFLRERLTRSVTEVQNYRDHNEVSSSGLRLELWKKSMAFVATAPIFGHGTGSMPELFRRSAVDATGATAVEAINPHNQYFAVAIQLGVIGFVILIAMWGAHLALFRGTGLIQWIGLVIVLQSVVSGLFNSHLFDFLHGWLYVWGFGVVGGIALGQRQVPPVADTR